MVCFVAPRGVRAGATIVEARVGTIVPLVVRVSDTTLPALRPGGGAPGVLLGRKLTLIPLRRLGDLRRGCRGAGGLGCCWLEGLRRGVIEAGIAALGGGITSLVAIYIYHWVFRLQLKVHESQACTLELNAQQLKPTGAVGGD